MKALVWSHPGLEEVTVHELRKLASNIKTNEPFILFDVRKEDELSKICYLCRSIRGAIQLLGSCRLAELEKALPSLDVSVAKGRTFAVRAKKFDDDVESRELEVLAGSIITKQTESKVNLDNPDITFLVLVSKGQCFIGIDFAGIDLGKRDYKLFSAPASLKGSLAFGMLSLAGFKTGQTLLDPCARDGVIGIEAALFSINKSPQFYQKDRLAFTKLPFHQDKIFEPWDKTTDTKSTIILLDSLFHNVQSVKKNARIAGVDKIINVSRMDLDWLDTKFDKESVDLIASYPPQQTERSDTKTIGKLYSELFHQAQFILRPKGKMILAMRSTKPLDNAPMKPKKVFQVSQGKEVLSLVLFEK
jgi:23S rRNA G2445 N2-methylase RlmL